MWKVIEEYPNYEIDCFGNVRNTQTKVTKKSVHGCVRLYKDNKEYRVYVRTLMNKHHPKMEDTWRTIPCFSKYEVSLLGEIRNKHTGKVIKGSINSEGYIQSGLTNDTGETKSVKFHRLIAITFIPNPNEYQMIDHINCVRTDNRVENLRWADAHINTWNRTTIKNSIYKGVCWNKEKQKYMAYITHNNTTHRLGYFGNADDAAKAYNKKAEELGTSCLNTIHT